ncbi:MAG: ABC transporter permease subunit [Alphaproteobacteria bacterium]|nr:ABC transporter permease subunit [Alphaproteobacteria bacterium]MBL6940351.1 ABC transporter permease subunit [Alphaproteobacteria bacterium]MBL7098191.1 ABC transporter permease subunit [Alphaproteobacteria bacterium]
MLHFALREAGRLALGLLGALLMAAALAALGNRHVTDGVLPFLKAWGAVLGGLFQLDLGHSAISGGGVWDELATHLPLTLELVGEGLVLALLVGIPVGFLFGAGPARRAAAPLAQALSAAPIFVGALVLAYITFHVLHWPVAVGTEVKTSLKLVPHTMPELREALLPVLTIGLAGAAAAQLGLRRATVETMHEPWRVQLRRMGLTAWDVERAYVLPAVLAGLFKCLGEVVLALLSAAAVTEWVFGYAGAADLFVKSVALRDWHIAAAVLFVFAGLTMTAHFIGTCLARSIADPGAPTPW